MKYSWRMGPSLVVDHCLGAGPTSPFFK